MSNEDEALHQAELAVLGAMLRDNATIAEVAGQLDVDHFREHAHRTIYAAILNLSDAGQPADLVTLANLLHGRGQLEDVGRYAYLSELLGAAPTAANTEHYATIVRDRAELRQLERAAIETVAEVHGRCGTAGQLLAALERRLLPLRGEQDRRPTLKLHEIEAADLAAAEADVQLDYLPLLGLDGYLVRGWSHLLAGYPRCGKTELVAACCRDWLAAGESVLYLTEEPEHMWRHRLARAGGCWSGMRLVFGLGADPSDLLERLRRGTETIAVVDTIRNLGIITDENDNAVLARELTPWVATARKCGKTLLLAHHMRKGAGEHGEGIAGGHALLGTVDIALELRHDTAPGRRLLRAYARVIQPAELVYERREDGTMHALGSPESVSLEEVRRRAREAVEEEWAKTAEVRERLAEPRPSLSQLRRALLVEAEAGAIERDPPLSVGPAERKTHRWRRAASPG